uniref:Uncharacterized protein n=1 Tax=Nymphaea colorata TaxID=210225 RepID=A0A5K1E1Q5_9MAGN
MKLEPPQLLKIQEIKE